MEPLPEDTIISIERLHSQWIASELAGGPQGLLACCAEDIELRPPDGPPVFGREAILGYFSQGNANIYSIEITGRRLFGSGESVSLTANYKTTFSTAGDPAPIEATGSHRWELRKEGSQWLVFLVTWSATIGQVI